MNYYEAHITMENCSPNTEFIVSGLGWKFSKIDGDANLGAGVKCYATRQFKGSKSKEEVLKELEDAAKCLDSIRPKIKILRKKIEVVIYDTRSKKVRFECKGDCVECHTEPKSKKKSLIETALENHGYYDDDQPR